ncbi:MAG: putative zinc-finger [Gemmatimonadetes bacterium]|nr:putative zinc-finger [Gemmatimonadota bacterium]
MPTCNQIRDRLDDWVAGRLPGDLTVELEQHLARCQECRLDADATGTVRAALDGLPSSVPPGRELWVGIEHRIADRSRRRQLRTLATAAAVVLAAGLGLVATIRRATAPDASPAPTADALSQYRQAALELDAALDRRSLPPDVRQALDRDLLVLDAAIAETGARLRAGAANPELRALAESAWRSRLALLRRMAAYASS